MTSRTSRPLRYILSVQFISLALLPFMLVTVLGFVWFFPQINNEIENRERQLSATINFQVESYLNASFAELKAISSLPIEQEIDPKILQYLLDGHVTASIAFRSIYVVGENGRVRAVGLSAPLGGSHAELLHQDIVGLDFSRNLLVGEVMASHGHAWSDTFLSIVGGGLSVAIAQSADNEVVIGEISLDKLTEYLKRIVHGDDQRRVFILDRHAQVIADQDGRYTAQQLNLNNIPMVSHALSTASDGFGRFKFEDRTMLGTLTKTPLVSWYVLVAQPVATAYSSAWTSARIIVAGLFTSLLFAIFLALHLSRKLAMRFDILETHARSVAKGQSPGEWPQGPIAEFNHLGSDLQKMAEAISQREMELLQTTQRLKLATASEHLGVWDWDIQSNALIWDARMFELYGIEPGTFSGTVEAWENGLHPTDRAKAIAAIEAAIRDDKDYDIEFRVVLPNGTVKDIKAVGKVTRDAEGKPVRMIGLNRDITEQRRTEAFLRQSQKMEAIGILAGGIAHDFNNILGAILGYTELAIEDVPPGSLVAKDLGKVMIAALRAKDLVKQILAFSRQAAADKMSIKIQPLVKETLKMLRASIPSTISITEDICPQSATVLADPTQIHQIVMNLCTNAYHAMEATGGELSVKVSQTTLDSQSAEDRQIAPGEYVELTVSDTGAGIGSDIIDKIFDPYFTTKEVGKGSGMGLSITHGIIKSYGGAITVESTLGKGTTFHVLLPATQQEATDAEELKAGSTGQGRILFVDDEEALMEIGHDMLERLGYRVTSRSSGFEALEIFMNDPHQFDLVITDQTMPGMTGVDLARRLLQVRPDLPIILCTGFSNLVNEESAKSIGIKEFAFKPMTKSSIGQLIRKALGEPGGELI